MRAVLTGLMLLSGTAIGAMVLAAEGPTSADLDGALTAVFGTHQGMRTSHAKGVCLKGSFTPLPGASDLSKAPQFARAVPIIGRLSMGGGNPEIPDATKATVRGFAIRFELGDGRTSNLAMMSAPMFLVRTPEQFMSYFGARVPVAPGQGPDQAKIDAFAKANPETTRQVDWLNAHPVPASWAGVNYWGVHAFTLINARGERRIVKFKAVPKAGELGLTDEEANAKPNDFYEEELKQRLGKGPVTFDLVAIMGEPGDPTGDPTAMWDEDHRTKTPLGEISIEAFNDNEVCDAFTFQPADLPDGIEGPADDPIFMARPGADTLSLIRRSQ